ncbi:MAG: MerR family transcriptional regulator [Micrococcus sp.]|nr:MerR family transcriptional regulator [Micrococcus sp.]
MSDTETTDARRPRHSSGASSQRLTIGAVLAELQDEFPDLAASKLRFLEERGLVTPHRSPSGYRHYGPEHVQRLRVVLTLQRDLFLPLARIREHLEALDRGERPEGIPASLVFRTQESAEAAAADAGALGQRCLTIDDLATATGTSAGFIEELVQFGILPEATDNGFGRHARQIVRAAHALAEHGLGPRHLRTFRMAADRELGALEQVLTPMTARPTAGTADRVAEAARQLEAAAADLHSALLGDGLERWHG